MRQIYRAIQDKIPDKIPDKRSKLDLVFTNHTVFEMQTKLEVGQKEILRQHFPSDDIELARKDPRYDETSVPNILHEYYISRINEDLKKVDDGILPQIYDVKVSGLNQGWWWKGYIDKSMDKALIGGYEKVDPIKESFRTQPFPPTLNPVYLKIYRWLGRLEVTDTYKSDYVSFFIIILHI